MKPGKRPFYIGYHHLTYACFIFVLAQIIFLVCIQTVDQNNTSEIFFEEKPYLLYTLKSNLETLDYQQSQQNLLKQIRSQLYTKFKKLTYNINIIPSWKIAKYTQRKSNLINNSPFYITNYKYNPYLLKVDFPLQKMSVYIEFNISQSLLWSSFIISIFIMIAFLISWVVFIYGFNLSFKTRILQGFLLPREEQRRNTAKDLTGELIHEIQTLMDQKSIMLSALSHDLKTPLTELELKLYLLEDQELASNLLGLTSDINNIITTSLQYAKGFEHVEKETYDLVMFINQIVSTANTPNKPVTFTAQMQNCYYEIEPTMFKRLFTNLIVNAKKYADNCDIYLERNYEDKIKLIIEDNGQGVPQNQIKTLGDPFFRADTSRSRKTGGTGLGLAIVKQIAKIHSFIISFENKPSGGLRITLSEI